MGNILQTYQNIHKEFVNNRNNEVFKEYLFKQRKLSIEVVEEFKLGYNNRWFKVKEGEPLIGKDAVVIPTIDFYNRIVAFQSRFVHKTEIKGREMRYLNTYIIPGVYEKKKTLYNLPNVIKNYYDRTVYIVEGVFDLMACYSQGIKNIVATVGNRLSEETIEMLYRYFDKITFVMDGGDQGIEMINFKNDRLKSIELYGVQINNINNNDEVKDTNDMLINDIDIKDYINNNKKPLGNDFWGKWSRNQKKGSFITR